MFELFKTLLGAQSQYQNLLVQANAQFCEMLDLAGEVLEQLVQRDEPGNLADEARQADKASNRMERGIRKLLVEHLAFGQADAPACLVLMSVAKDGERIVDLVRDLVAVLPDCAESLRPRLIEQISNLRQQVASTRAAFATNNEPAALALVEGEKPDFASYDAIAEDVLKQDSLAPLQYARTWHCCEILERLRAHLGNIASTVVFPVHRIDFVKDKFIRDARKQLGIDS